MVLRLNRMRSSNPCSLAPCHLPSLSSWSLDPWSISATGGFVVCGFVTVCGFVCDVARVGTEIWQPRFLGGGRVPSGPMAGGRHQPLRARGPLHRRESGGSCSCLGGGGIGHCAALGGQQAGVHHQPPPVLGFFFEPPALPLLSSVCVPCIPCTGVASRAHEVTRQVLLLVFLLLSLLFLGFMDCIPSSAPAGRVQSPPEGNQSDSGSQRTRQLQLDLDQPPQKQEQPPPTTNAQSSIDAVDSRDLILNTIRDARGSSATRNHDWGFSGRSSTAGPGPNASASASSTTNPPPSPSTRPPSLATTAVSSSPEPTLGFSSEPRHRNPASAAMWFLVALAKLASFTVSTTPRPAIPGSQMMLDANQTNAGCVSFRPCMLLMPAKDLSHRVLTAAAHPLDPHHPQA